MTNGVRYAGFMAKTPTERQREYRDRIAGTITRLASGHRSILVALGDNEKPLAVKLRAISTEALGEAK